MPSDEQAGNGSGNVCAVMGCEGGDLFRLDIMGQPTTAYLCGDHVGFVRQFSLTTERLVDGVIESEPLSDKTWDWCGYHKTHPMISFDPAGTPYCWEGWWKHEVDECASVPPIIMNVAPATLT